jgi:Rrf2 family protein
MMSLSSAVGYALRAMACLAEERCSPGSVKVVAACSGVPAPYLAKIFKRLKASGLVKARRGVGGGVWLAQAPKEIPLLAICEAMDGPDWLGDCLFGAALCHSGRACPTAKVWNTCKTALRREMTRLTLADIIALKRTPICTCRSATTRRKVP